MHCQLVNHEWRKGGRGGGGGGIEMHGHFSFASVYFVWRWECCCGYSSAPMYIHTQHYLCMYALSHSAHFSLILWMVNHSSLKKGSLVCYTMSPTAHEVFWACTCTFTQHTFIQFTHISHTTPSSHTHFQHTHTLPPSSPPSNNTHTASQWTDSSPEGPATGAES